MTVTRDAINAALRAALEPRSDVHALSEAGSAAFGEDDIYSDIDLSVDIDDGSEDAVWEAIEATLSGLSPLEHRHHIAQPAWHGMAQRFYRLRDTSEWLVLDIVLRTASKRGTFTERERHGEAHVSFDKNGSTEPIALDRAKLAVDRSKRLDTIRTFAPLLCNLARKEALRGRPLDALGFYHGLVLRPLVDVLRSRYCPDRWDYGLRYLERDLPKDVHDRLARLAYVADLPELEAKAGEAEAWLSEELSAEESARLTP